MNNRKKTKQELFWEDEYAIDYMKKNTVFDVQLGADAWSTIFSSIKKYPVKNYLECDKCR